MPQAPHIVATWSDAPTKTGKGQVFFFNLAHLVNHFTGSSSASSGALSGGSDRPFFTHTLHKDEGWALGWSPLVRGLLFSGDNRGAIFKTQISDNGGADVDPVAYEGHTGSVEDIVCSPTEAEVFASCSSDKTIRIWDSRVKKRCAAWITAHKTDVNVISWNSNRDAEHLLVSGGDDGSIKVWDLRNFNSSVLFSSFFRRVFFLTVSSPL